MRTIEVYATMRDEFNRQLYKCVGSPTVYVDVNDVEGFGTLPKYSGELHTITAEGEPDMPLRNTKIEIIIPSMKRTSLEKCLWDADKEYAKVMNDIKVRFPNSRLFPQFNKIELNCRMPLSVVVSGNETKYWFESGTGDPAGSFRTLSTETALLYLALKYIENDFIKRNED